MSRKVDPRDVSDAQWECAVSYLTLIREDAGPRVHALRDVCDRRALDGQGGWSAADVARRLSALASGRAASQAMDASRLF